MIGYNRTGRRTDADACSSAYERGQDGGAAGSSRAFLEAARASRKPARKKLWRGEAFGLQSDSTSSSTTRSLLSPRLPPFIDQEGSRFPIKFLPTESNYLGSPLYLIPCYIQKGARTREESVPTRYAPVALGDGFLHDTVLVVSWFDCT